MTKAQDKQNEIDNAIKHLKTMIKAGATVYTVCHHVSSSGMMRHISCYIAYKGAVVNISYYVAKAIDYKQNKDNGALVVGGCGMDMGFHVVYALSRTLFKRGFTSKGVKHKDGGYALYQQWL